MFIENLQFYKNGPQLSRFNYYEITKFLIPILKVKKEKEKKRQEKIRNSWKYID